MNFRNIKILFSVLLLVALCVACVQDDDYKNPSFSVEKPIIEGDTITIDAVLGILAQELLKNGANAKVLFKETNNYIVGFVVSSDKGGNFYEKLIVQDSPANPTAGISVLIDVNPLYTSYEFGRKVYIKLEGLSIGMEHGVPSLGVIEGDEVGNIPSFMQNKTIIRSEKTETITPLKLRFEDFSDHKVNMYIKVENVQFRKKDVLVSNPLTFAAEPGDKYSGERFLESCITGGISIVSTSTFADFRAIELSTQQGSIEGILTKDYYGTTFNLVLNNPSGLVFDNPQRCDPDVLNCQREITAGTTIVFQDTFDTYRDASDIETAGYTNVNISNGGVVFETSKKGNNSWGLRISAYKTGENPVISWLVTPKISLQASSSEVLTFETAVYYDQGLLLDVFITENYTGDPITTQWMSIENANIPSGSTTVNDMFQSSGSIDISCLSGDIWVGFRYTGGDSSGKTTTYTIDNVTITGK